MELTSTLRLCTPPPALPPKTRIGHAVARSTTLTSLNAFNRMVPTLDAPQHAAGDPNTNNKSTSATVFVCAPPVNDEATFQLTTPESGDPSSHPGSHVVKIQINPKNSPKTKSISTIQLTVQQEEPLLDRDHGQDVNIADSHRETTDENDRCVRICIQDTNMLKNSSITSENFTKPIPNGTAIMAIRSTGPNSGPNATPYFFYNGFQCSPPPTLMSSGQCSPSDTLDSGTCSDLDCTPPPPPLPKKKNQKVEKADENLNTEIVKKLEKYDELSDAESNISCDSLNSSELNGSSKSDEGGILMAALNQSMPQGLLQDIRDRTARLSVTACDKPLVDESTYEDRQMLEKQTNGTDTSTAIKYLYETDRYYNFHLNETVRNDSSGADSGGVCAESASTKQPSQHADDDESFAGYKDLLDGQVPATIRSAKGTIRGVKNRVRAGIATFLQIHSTTKNYREKDAGKVVVYTTTMGIVRATYHQCVKVKQILRTHLVKFEERDVFMSSDYQSEIRDRMQSDQILIPQVFVDGQHVGNAETIERLNECGELRRILKPYKSADACSTCQVCGGYRLLPCPVCNGSKKSVHRNHFTTEFVALKCMNCDEVGLVRCYACSS